MPRVDRDTDYPMAIGVIVGYSGLDIDLRAEFDWAEALVKAIDNTRHMDGNDRAEVQKAVSILLGIGACIPADALTRLRVRPSYE